MPEPRRPQAGPWPSTAAIVALASCWPQISDPPDPFSGQLRRALGHRYGLPAEAFVVGPGTASLLHGLVVRAAMRGARAVHSQPSFFLYGQLAADYGLESQAVPLRDYHHDLTGIAAALGGTRSPSRRSAAPVPSTVGPGTAPLVLLDSPHNVAGTVVSMADVLALARSAPAGTVIVYDNVYGEYQDAPAADLDAELHAAVGCGLPVIVARSFSKAYQLFGLRIGYLVAAPPVLAEFGPLVLRYDVATPAQRAAEASLGDRAGLEATTQLIATARQQIQDRLTGEGLRVIAGQSGAVLVDAGAHAEALERALLEAGCQVRTAADHGLSGHLQIFISDVLTPDRVHRALTLQRRQPTWT